MIQDLLFSKSSKPKETVLDPLNAAGFRIPIAYLKDKTKLKKNYQMTLNYQVEKTLYMNLYLTFMMIYINCLYINILLGIPQIKNI